MILKFVDRENELGILKNSLYKPILVYGRRRIGKTELIKQFIKNKKVFYFICHKNKLQTEFQRFVAKFNKEFNIFIEAKNFEEFFEQIRNKEIIIVLDEFSYLVEKNPEVSSIFQEIIDEIIKKSDLTLIFCGSLIGTMESLLSYKNPLYGRIKTRLKLKEIDFKYLKIFLPDYSIEDIIKVYACVGGIPAYISEFNDKISFMENLNKLFFRKESFFYDDAERILKDELREPDIYFRIIEAITNGETTLGKIASYAHIDITNLPKHLKILEKMDIVKKINPLFLKKGLWKVADNYFNFWINFIYPYSEEIELGIYKFPYEKFNCYVSFVFEEVCKQAIIEMTQKGKFGFTKTGRWWYEDKEIDLVALNELNKEILFGECKWKEKVNSMKVCKELAEKSEYVKWHNEERKESFAVFAKSFSKKIKDFEGKKVYCFDLKDLEKSLK